MQEITLIRKEDQHEFVVRLIEETATGFIVEAVINGIMSDAEYSKDAYERKA